MKRTCRCSETVNALSYKPHLKEVQTRLRSLYQREAADRIFATMAVPNTALTDFARAYPHGTCGYPDLAERIRFWDDYFRQRAAVEDDAMPAAYLSELDQGLYGGLLGGDVRFMADPATGWISSMVPPLLADWSEFDRLRFDPAHPWWRRYLRQLDAFVGGSRGKFGISHFILIDGLNFVFELLGATRTYLSLDEQPEMVRRAIDFAFDSERAGAGDSFSRRCLRWTAAPSATLPNGCPAGWSRRASTPTT